ncbi:MAG: tetratricopeptide repeat protein [Candidatus Rifleibacteriota bacterium]
MKNFTHKDSKKLFYVTKLFQISVLSFLLVFSLSPLNGQEFDTARFWKAAEDGDPIAQFYVGFAYYHGINGFETDKEQGRYWLTKSADQGDADAQYYVGMILFNLASQMLQEKKLKGSRDVFGAVDEFSVYFEKSSKQGQPLAFHDMSMVEYINDKPEKQVMYYKILSERLRPYDDKTAQLYLDNLEKNLPGLNEQQERVTALDAIKLDTELPLQVCKLLTPKVVLDLEFLPQNKAEQILNEAFNYFQSRFPKFLPEKPMVKCISRDELANLYRKQTGFEFGISDRGKIDCISISRALMNFGTFSVDDNTIYLVPRSVMGLLKAYQLDTSNADEYVKLFMVEKLAYKWAADNFAASRLKFKPGYVAGLLSAFQKFVTNLVAIDFKVSFEAVRAGCLSQMAKSDDPSESDASDYTNRLEAGIRFFDYICFTYGFEEAFKAIQNSPEGEDVIAEPQKFRISIATDSASVEESFKTAVGFFKNQQLTEAKQKLRELFAFQFDHAQARFLHALIAAKEKDFYTAWKNVEFIRKSLSGDQKFKKFVSDLNKAAPEKDYLE